MEELSQNARKEEETTKKITVNEINSLPFANDII